MSSTQPIVLSDSQQRVISYRGGGLRVIACAGSGKTESISRRVASLICDDKVEPAAIVAFTFTERAAAQLKERIMHRVAEQRGRAFLDRLSPMFVGTIHGYCFHMLQRYVPRYGKYDVLDEHRHVGLLTREFFELGLAKFRRPRESPTQRWIRTVDVIGNELIPEGSLSGILGQTYQRYRSMLETGGHGVRLSYLANLANVGLPLLEGMHGSAAATVCTWNSLPRDRARELSTEDFLERARLPGVFRETRAIPQEIRRGRIDIFFLRDVT